MNPVEEYNKKWLEKEMKQKYALSTEGMAQYLKEQLNVDFSTIEPRTDKYFDDNCRHYIDSIGIKYKYDKRTYVWSLSTY